MADLALVDPGILERSGAQVTPTSLSLNGALEYEEYEALAAFCGQVNNASRWWISDLLQHVEAHRSELLAQVAEATQLAPQTIENITSVGRRVPPQRRRNGVSFSCHAEVAALAPVEQKSWLAIADDERLTKTELRARIRDSGPDIQEREVCPTCQRPL